MKAEGRAIEENEGVRMSLGFPDGTAVKEKKKKHPPACAGDKRGLDSIPGSGSSLEKERQPAPELLPGNSRGQRGLVGPWGHRELDLTEQSPAAV